MAADRGRADAGRQPRARCSSTRARCGAPTRSSGGEAPGLRDPAARTGRRREPGGGAGDGARPARRRARDRERRRRCAFAPDDEALLTVVATMVASAIEIDWAHERADERRRAGDAGRARGRDRPAPGDHPCALLRGRRQHVPRRRLPHQGRRRPHPVGAARPLRPRGPRRVHQQGGAARPVARAARVPRQPREPTDPAEAPARRTRRARSASRRPVGAASGSSWTRELRLECVDGDG